MSKKPSKRPSTHGTNVLKPKNEGTLIRFIGSGGNGHSCPQCKKIVVNGMLREYEGKMYCSKKCVLEVIPKEETN
jgi:hypothetical protein